jgi:hypothetical protein
MTFHFLERSSPYNLSTSTEITFLHFKYKQSTQYSVLTQYSKSIQREDSGGQY